ncbi:esterase family protein [Mycobacterium kansasii]|uniref:Esterase family protein n=1 Tax=Mycobacterium kansasii TaxID=1768 RepID=A0A1V3WUI7_MYCKA|nr:esterase family protein [Mycobacterium kansasii]
MIALHGKGSDAATVMAGGVEQGLAQAVNAGLPPFAVVAVDGGGSYWHKRASGEDSGAMVLSELIPLLDTHNLDTSRVAFLGWSMGGYGALLLGGRLGPARTAAICAVSPALWLTAGAAAPGAFDGADDFAANSVFGMPALGSIPIRVDCGDSDPFYSATKQFIAQLPNPPRAGSPRRAQRRVLELTAARRVDLDGTAADGVTARACEDRPVNPSGRPFGWSFPYAWPRMPILGRNVVATSQPLAAQAGLRMLAEGGTR